MKPYTLTISGDEKSAVYRALNKGLFCAKQQAAIGEIGAAEIVSQIEDAIAIMNRPCEGGFESNSERSAHFLARLDADCSAFGCD